MICVSSLAMYISECTIDICQTHFIIGDMHQTHVSAIYADAEICTGAFAEILLMVR